MSQPDFGLWVAQRLKDFWKLIEIKIKEKRILYLQQKFLFFSRSEPDWLWCMSICWRTCVERRFSISTPNWPRDPRRAKASSPPKHQQDNGLLAVTKMKCTQRVILKRFLPPKARKLDPRREKSQWNIISGWAKQLISLFTSSIIDLKFD